MVIARGGRHKGRPKVRRVGPRAAGRAWSTRWLMRSSRGQLLLITDASGAFLGRFAVRRSHGHGKSVAQWRDDGIAESERI